MKEPSAIPSPILHTNDVSVPTSFAGTERRGRHSPSSRPNHEEIKMRKVAIGIAAAVTLAAVAPANAQGLWVGAPGFGVGIGVGPTYAYEPYYGGSWGSPYWGAGYGYEPAYQSYAYEPEYEYDSYAYVPDDGYAVYSYGPRLRTYAYEPTDSYRYAPRVRYSRNYSYSPGVRATRSYSYADTRGVIKGDRGHRSTMVHNTRLQDRAAMRNGFAVGAERESAGSRRIRPEASRALARGPAQDLRQSKSIEGGKTGKSRVRSQTY